MSTITPFKQKQKLQQDLNSWSNFSLVLFGKGREIDRTTLINPCSNLWQHVATAFLPFAMETLGGLHPGAVATARQLAAALARCKGVAESVVTSQLFGRLSLTLMRANAVMISTRCQDADLPQALIDGIQ